METGSRITSTIAPGALSRLSRPMTYRPRNREPREPRRHETWTSGQPRGSWGGAGVQAIGGIVGVPGRAGAVEGLVAAIGGRAVVAQRLDRVGVGDDGPAEGDQVGEAGGKDGLGAAARVGARQ